MIGKGKENVAVGQQVIIVAGIFLYELGSALVDSLEKSGQDPWGAAQIRTDAVAQKFESSSRIAQSTLDGRSAGAVSLNGWGSAVVGKKPVMTSEFQAERVGVALIHRTAGLQADVAEDDSTVNHPCEPLESIVNSVGLIGLFC
jgi:hypothetical protein